MGEHCAQKYARDRRSRRRLKLTLKPVLRDHVIAKLREGWSPQQIAGRLKVGLRRYLPLGVPVAERTGPALAALAKRLNDTPRRCLDYRTPAEVFAVNLAASKTGR